MKKIFKKENNYFLGKEEFNNIDLGECEDSIVLLSYLLKFAFSQYKEYKRGVNKSIYSNLLLTKYSIIRIGIKI